MPDPQNNGVASLPTPASPTPPDPSMFINRELSWLDFNERVLEEARDPSNPLLERVRFLAICASNLDEFFEVRVAGLQAQLYDNLEPQDTPPDGLGPLAQLTEIARRARDFVARHYDAWRSEVRPQLAPHGTRVCAPDDLIGPRLDALFGGFKVAARAAFRVTRNSDLTIQETEVRTSLLSTIQETLRLRKWGAAVRLEISDRADDGFLAQLQTAPALDLDDRDVYKVAGPVALPALVALC